MNKKLLLFINILLLFPLNIYAYSNKVIIGGETIGIEVKSNGVYVVGFYEVNNKNIGQDAGFKKGDIIKKINDIEVKNLLNLNNVLSNEQEYIFEVERNNKIEIIKMKPVEENNVIKTGLYVKDTINGIGTLSYIDPETKIFGSLGHEIFESTSKEKFEIGEANIYKAEVSSIKKSERNITGEKNASINKEKVIGTITKNEISGIYGKYEEIEENSEIKEVATKEEIRKGKAKIRTVINKEEIEEYNIEIISINEQDSTKNILFKVIDNKLLDKTGGIIQGMSGSPIIQNDKIIGVVNYVIIDDETKGYGIFITTMLEEGDKINS